MIFQAFWIRGIMPKMQKTEVAAFVNLFEEKASFSAFYRRNLSKDQMKAEFLCNSHNQTVLQTRMHLINTTSWWFLRRPHEEESHHLKVHSHNILVWCYYNCDSINKGLPTLYAKTSTSANFKAEKMSNTIENFKWSFPLFLPQWLLNRVASEKSVVNIGMPSFIFIFLRTCQDTSFIPRLAETQPQEMVP